MEVTFRLVGILQDYYPEAAAAVDGQPARALEAGTTVRALLDGLGIPDEAEYFIMVNDTLVEPAAATARVLEAGDAVMLAPVIKGG